MVTLKIMNVIKRYKSKKVLNGINLEIKQGNIVALIGPSGVGKTTLLNIIMGLCYKDEGKIIYNGEELNIPYKKYIRSKIAYIPDNPIFYDYLTGMENLMYLKNIYDSEITDNQLEVYLRMFNLFNSKDKIFKEYSKGMKQKLMLLSTYITNADILILDEPTTGLDIVSCYELKDIIIDFKKMKKTILLATHDINFCQQVADSIAIIRNGQIVYEGINEKDAKLQELVIGHLK